MKAIVYARDCPEGVKMVERPRPALDGTAPGSGEAPGRQYVVCRMHGGGVNPVDAKFLYGDKLPHACLPLVQRKIEAHVCGIDFSGVVVEAPAGCQYAVGDRVFGTIPPLAGTFAEYVCAPIDSIGLLPENLSFAEGCVVPLVGLTALQAFEDNRLSAGQHVLVLGASGGTGHVAVQIAKIKGAYVTALCGQRNADFVRGLGADQVITYDADDFMARFATIVRERGPFDLVFDSVSSHDSRDARFAYERRIRGAQPRLMRENGMYVFIGGRVDDWVRAHVRRFLGVNLFAKGRELFWVRFPGSAADLAALARFCAAGQLKVTLAHCLPFTEEGVRQAFRLQMSRRIVGKIAIQI